MLWVVALIGEEIFDSLQRQMMDDPELQPMVQRLMRIHVTEEARHIQFARDGLRKRVPNMRGLNRLCVANSTGWAGCSSASCSPTRCRTAASGSTLAWRADIARTSQHHHEIQVAGFAPLAAFLEEVGLMGPIARRHVAAQRIPASMTEDCYDVVVLGVERAERRLTKAGITDFAVLESCDPDGAVFDEATHTWTLPTCRARIVISDQIRCGRDDLVPYLGVAAHGVPNYFMVTGADAVLAPRMRGTVADARLDYIAECLKLMRRTGSTRIEVRYSTQRMFHDRSRDKPDRADAAFWRRMRKLAPSAFDLSSHVGIDDDLYDGAASDPDRRR